MLSSTSTRFLKTSGMVTQPLPGQPVPVLHNLFGKEMFPNIQPKPPVAQLEAISLHLITWSLGEVPNPYLTIASFKATVERLSRFTHALEEILLT